MAGEVAKWSDGGKADRFKQLALPHLDEIYTLARYLLRNASDADDAVQECYLRAFRHFDKYHGPTIKPWLMAILRNVCHAAFSDNARLVYSADSVEGNEATDPMWCEDNETPEQEISRLQQSKTVRRLISELPAEFREVFVLREINDLPYRDIAIVIDAPIGTVMSRLARARVMLRAAWIAAETGSERL